LISIMVFTEEQYKFINLVAPDLSSYAEFMRQLEKDKTNGKIELLFRRIDHKQNFQFEAVIAHAGTFKLEWENVVFKTRILAYNLITAAKYDFKSKPFGGLDSFRILGDYCSLANACCDSLSLERDVNVRRERLSNLPNLQESYCLQGWMKGPVRNALVAHDYLRDNQGKGIGITGKLSYR